MTLSPGGHDEDGRLVPAVDFDYGALDRDSTAAGPEIELTQEDWDRACKAFTALMEWIWQNGMRNPDGVKIRAIICCWLMLKELRPLTLTQLARGYGLKKQSLGRWVDQFKLSFPHLRNPHMRNLEEHDAQP